MPPPKNTSHSKSMKPSEHRYLGSSRKDLVAGAAGPGMAAGNTLGPTGAASAQGASRSNGPGGTAPLPPRGSSSSSSRSLHPRLTPPQKGSEKLSSDRSKLWQSPSSSSSSSSQRENQYNNSTLLQKPSSVQKETTQQQRKGFWNWRPFRASSPVPTPTPPPPSPPNTTQRMCFHVLFSLHVKAIHGLPNSMNGLRLTIHWKRKEEGLQTMPSRIIRGSVEFDETLRQRCIVFGTRDMMFDQTAIKYESKLFTISVVALDVDGLELGQHHVDLSRLLPEEDIDDPNVRHCSGWSTSFQLSGKAKSSYLDVTFNYDLLHYESSEANEDNDGDGDGLTNDVALGNDSVLTKNAVLINDGNANNDTLESKQSLPQDSITSFELLAEKSGNSGLQEECTQSSLKENELDDFTLQDDQTEKIESAFNQIQNTSSHEVLITHGYEEWIEELKESQVTDVKVVGSGPGESPSSRGLPQDSQTEQIRGTFAQIECTFAQMESTFKHEVLVNYGTEEWNKESEEIEGVGIGEELNDERKSKHEMETEFDDEIELVAGEFLDMLDIGFGSGNSNSDGEPDTPRERLLRQCIDLFANEDTTTIRQVNDIIPYEDELQENWESDGDMQLASIMEAAKVELQKAAQSMKSKSRAKALEDEETQALMREWGLSEKAFQNSPPKPKRSSSMLGPHLPIPPPLGNGLGPVLNLKDGGSLRSMSPSLFSKNKASGGSSLVMQASKPVVVPCTMGTTTVEILRHLASLGMDTLGKQAMAAMPLQDITGMLTNETIAMNILEDQVDQSPLQHGNRNQNSSFMGIQSEMGVDRAGSRKTTSNNKSKDKLVGGYDDYVSLEDLAPLAMENIESLAIDGLKIQADMPEEDAPSYLDAAAWGILDDTKRRQDKDSISLSDGVAGLHFKSLQRGDDLSLETKNSGPLSMAITLDEWAKLDKGVLEGDKDTKEKSLAILAAHNAFQPDWEGEDGKRAYAKKGGIMGNTLMIAMLVQLRDPLRNFEPVGAPMMALIQAERVMVPPKPRIGRRVSVKGNNEQEDGDDGDGDDDDEVKAKAKGSFMKEDMPQFKLMGVHMSGLKSIEDDDDEVKAGKGSEIQKKGWGSQKQIQSGSRWLLAQGMTKSSSKQHSLLKSKGSTAPAQTKVKPGETLWSISARVNGSGQKWRDLAALNPHIRNPDVIFSNETIRTR